MTNKMSRNNHSMTLTISAVMMSLGLGASQAMAQDAATPPQEPVAVAAVAADAVATPAPGSFEALDANADAALAKEEIPAGDPLLKKFKKADTDKDGHLNKDEFNAYLAKR